MLKRAQFPFPVPLGKPIGARQSFYWVAYSACLAASWSEARARSACEQENWPMAEAYRIEVERFLEVAFEHMLMRAQATEIGLEDEKPSRFSKIYTGEPN